MNARAHGAITIINATATGRGCSLAVDLPTTASWTWSDDYAWEGSTDDLLARAILERIAPLVGKEPLAHIDCASPVPPSRGLKTSSSAAAAMARAAIADANMRDAGIDIEQLCTDAAIDAGVTVTGAFDDQVAVTRGGCHLTDNRERRVLYDVDVPAFAVAIWVPDASIHKSQVRDIDAHVIHEDIETAEQHLLDGDIDLAMMQNSEAFMRLYRAHGLPVDHRPIDAARQAGANAAGLSGTGPAVAALFDAPARIPDVSGGTWIWTEAV